MHKKSAISSSKKTKVTRAIPLKFYWLVFLAAASLRVTLTSLGVFIEDISADLALSKALTSLVVTIPTFCMGVCALLAKPISRRFGLEKTLLYMLLLVALATIFRTHFSSVTLLLFFSFVMGLSIAVAGPLLTVFINRYFKKNKNHGMALYSLGISISGVLGTLVGSFFRNQMEIKWNIALEIWALPVFIVTLYWALHYFAYDSFNSSKKRKVEKEDAPPVFPWKEGKAWLLIFTFALQSQVFYNMIAWLIPYLQEEGLTLFHSSNSLNMFTFSGLFGGLVFPFLLARFGQKTAAYTCATLLFLGVLTLLFLLESIPLLYLGAFLVGMCANGMFVIVLTLPFYRVSSDEEIANWSVMILFGGYLFSALVPTFFGYIYDLTASYRNIMWGILISTLLIYLCFFLFFMKEKPKTVKTRPIG